MSTRAEVEDVGLLNPWDLEMNSFADGSGKSAVESVDEDGAFATLHNVE